MKDDVIGPPVAGLAIELIDGHVTIYAPQTQRALILNASASVVWTLSDGKLTADEIVDATAVHFGESPDIVRPGVLQAIQTFREQQLFETADQVRADLDTDHH